MSQIEFAVKLSLRKQLALTLLPIKSAPKKKREHWIRSSIGQLLVLSAQIWWTSQCEKALSDYGNGNKSALRKLKKQWKKYVDRLTVMVRNLNSSENSPNTENADLLRSKLEALMVTEVHGRDVIERLMRSPRVKDVNSWEWAIQLRFEYLEGKTAEKGSDAVGTAYAVQVMCSVMMLDA